MISEKELEEIYRKIKEEETPDLWERIETGLEEIPPQKKKNRKWIISFSALAAAVLIFFVASPLFSLVKDKQNNFKGLEDVSDTNGFSNEITEKIEDDADKESTPINADEMNEDNEMSVKGDESSTFTANKECSEKDLDGNEEKEISTITINGITLIEVEQNNIEKLEAVEEKQLPNELQNVIEELKKKEKKQQYYRDMDEVYYVKIKNKIYRIYV